MGGDGLEPPTPWGVNRESLEAAPATGRALAALRGIRSSRETQAVPPRLASACLVPERRRELRRRRGVDPPRGGRVRVHPLANGAKVEFGSVWIEVLETPGHSRPSRSRCSSKTSTRTPSTRRAAWGSSFPITSRQRGSSSAHLTALGYHQSRLAYLGPSRVAAGLGPAFTGLLARLGERLDGHPKGRRFEPAGATDSTVRRFTRLNGGISARARRRCRRRRHGGRRGDSWSRSSGRC